MNLITYVRGTNGRRVGLVVATGRDRIGWSTCNVDKDIFDKELGLKIAVSRSNSSKLQNKLKSCLSTNVSSIWRDLDVVSPEMMCQIKKMSNRAKKYFKDQENKAIKV